MTKKNHKEIALFLKDVLNSPLWKAYYTMRREIIESMKINAIRSKEDNRHERGEVFGRDCEIHELEAFVLTHGTDEDTSDTSSKT